MVHVSSAAMTPCRASWPNHTMQLVPTCCSSHILCTCRDYSGRDGPSHCKFPLLPADHAAAAESMPRASCCSDQAQEASSDCAMMPTSNPLGDVAAVPIIDTSDIGTATVAAPAPAAASSPVTKHDCQVCILSTNMSFCWLLAQM